MMGHCGKPELLSVLITFVAVAISIGAPARAVDPATQARCSAYPQRAVEQFRLMQSHPQCNSRLDPLAWKDDYTYHFNGCTIFPEKMSVLADQLRDAKLRDCASPAAISAATPTATTAAARGCAASATAASRTAAGTVGNYMSVPLGNCQIPIEVRMDATNAPRLGVGRATKFEGGVLTLHDYEIKRSIDPNEMSRSMQGANAITGDTLPLIQLKIVRPKFFGTSCSGFPAGTAGGPWMAMSGPSAPRYLLVGADGMLQWAGVTPQVAESILNGTTTAKPAAAATPATTPAKAAAPKPAVKPTKR
jgi:hypothetical protein